MTPNTVFLRRLIYIVPREAGPELIMRAVSGISTSFPLIERD
jgi:hypothetical protein